MDDIILQNESEHINNLLLRLTATPLCTHINRQSHTLTDHSLSTSSCSVAAHIVGHRIDAIKGGLHIQTAKEILRVVVVQVKGYFSHIFPCLGFELISHSAKSGLGAEILRWGKKEKQKQINFPQELSLVSNSLFSMGNSN